MVQKISATLERAIADLPARFPGPGGVVAVVRDGIVLVRHAWGFADLENRVPYLPTTLAPICSITKQFTCALMLDVAPDPAVLDSAIAAQLPRLKGDRPTALDLANNQSGLRDYWAMTVLCGALPEGEFRPEDATRLFGLTETLHFAPGNGYSYSNGNFRILATAIETMTGRPFGELLVERISAPAGMATAVFKAETSALPGGAVGYEGNPDSGYRPGINRIHWTGDAGLCASLDDMIAWETFIDRHRDDPQSPYRRLSGPVAFADGQPAAYGLGLVRKVRFGRDVTGHGGAIRGWRSHRLHVAAERLSVVVVFNHESDAQAAATAVLGAALAVPDQPGASDAAAAFSFIGDWLDADQGLLLCVTAGPAGTLLASYAGGSEPLSIGADGVARGTEMSLTLGGEGLSLVRPGDNIDSHATRLTGDCACTIEGVFHSSELGADMAIVNSGGSWFAGFRGILGEGPLMPLLPVAADVWRLGCRRSLDAPAPGDWTVQIHSAPDGGVGSVTVGCWLARRVVFSARSPSAFAEP